MSVILYRPQQVKYSTVLQQRQIPDSILQQEKEYKSYLKFTHAL